MRLYSKRRQRSDWAIMMAWTNRLFALLWMFSIFRCSDMVLIEQECPAQFEDGEAAQMTCIVSKSAVSDCVATPTNLIFSITREGSTNPEQLCQVSYENVVCSTSGSSSDCACIQETTTSLTFVYRFSASRDRHDNGKLACRLCTTLTGSVPPPSSCDKVVFAPETTSPSPAKAAPSAPETTSPSPSSSPSPSPAKTTPTAGASNVKSGVLGVMGSVIIAILLMGWTPVSK